MRLQVSGIRSQVSGKIIVLLSLCAVVAFAAPKSASAYYGDAAFQYIENRLPSAEITCNEGLQYYPNDQKLQMLLDRIHEAKDEQKNENQKNDKNQDQNQDKNQDQDQNKDQDQNQDQNQNQDENKDDQNGESSSSGEQDQNQQNQGENGESSSSAGESSDSNGGADEQPEQPENGSSDSQGAEPEEQPVQMGEMSKEEADQLLKDFDEQNGERKPWKPVRGQARPAKDW